VALLFHALPIYRERCDFLICSSVSWIRANVRRMIAPDAKASGAAYDRFRAWISSSSGSFMSRLVSYLCTFRKQVISTGQQKGLGASSRQGEPLAPQTQTPTNLQEILVDPHAALEVDDDEVAILRARLEELDRRYDILV
jgi:hypothetical protein